ncbi:immunity 8 family protein [Bradyrhizobium sp. SZCCHNPS1003]|uniref:immunity 8 family protein n=1 Tax=Bradyrhizobium sp. SZCCHNPS1003 TaxID=3057330 RepID=UPI0039657FD6
MIVANLRRLTSTDVDLVNFQPSGDFGVYVLALVGPAGSVGEESFGLTICTTGWFEKCMNAPIVSGRHHLFVKRFDYDAIISYLEKYCTSCSGNSWREVADKVARIGYWEFEDYRPE